MQETSQEYSNQFYQDPFFINYWLKKCRCKADSVIISGAGLEMKARDVQGKAIWTAAGEEGPWCKQCDKPWRLEQ